MGWSLHHPHGLIYYAPQYCHRGYTLFANLRGNEANLIDMEGRICHRWYWSGGINYANLLPNGNTLICEGATGRFIEVTQGHQIVWEFINPLFADSGRIAGGSSSGQANSVFRAHRFAADDPALRGRDLDPARYANLNRTLGTG